MHLRRDTNIYAKNYNFPNPIGSKTRTLFYHFISLVVVVVVLPYLYIYANVQYKKTLGIC